MLIYAETNWGTRVAIPIGAHSTAREVKRVKKYRLSILIFLIDELERAHVNCFPELGEIRVKALTVNRKSCLYHLSESLPLAYVSEGLTDTLFLHVEPHFSLVNNQLISTEPVAANSLKRAAEDNGDTNLTQLGNLGSCINGRKIKRIKRMKKLGCPKFTFREIWRVANYPKRKRRGNRCKDYKSISCLNHRFSQEEHASIKRLEVLYGNGDDKLNKGLLSRTVLESPSGTLLESVSVSGIIRKYFSIHDEVTSSYDNSSPTTPSHKDQCKERTDSCSLSMHLHTSVLPRVKPTPKRLPISSPDEPSHGSLIIQNKKPNVGNRLLVASGTLGLSACKQPSSLLLSKFREVPTQNEAATYIRSLVFDISDTDN
ncbi:hypothetical protein Leryth_010145 [Lithospermum erythrorhizon]|nr:hypothetical protein Leryth_010145 [Lithospermum erythrorhizon]